MTKQMIFLSLHQCCGQIFRLLFLISGLTITTCHSIISTNVQGKEEPSMKQRELYSVNNMMMCGYNEGSSPDLADA